MIISKLTNTGCNDANKINAIFEDIESEINDLTPHNLLSIKHRDTLTASVVDGDMIIGNVTPKWSKLVISIPAANVRNVLGIDNGELRPSWKTALDSTNPTTIGINDTAAPGTSLVFAHRDHKHASPATWTATAHNILDSTYHGDTLTASVVDGDMIIGNVTPKWSKLVISIPAANVRNVLGIDNGELRPSWKTALDSTNPTTIGINDTAAPGTSLVFAHRDHQHASPSTWTATAHNILDSTYHGDVLTGSITRGDILYGNSTPKIARLAKGTNGYVLQSNATDVLWGAVVNTNLGNLGTAGTHAKFAATGLADSLLSETANDVIIGSTKRFGLGAGKGGLTFTDAATDTITFDNCNVGVGTTAPLADVGGSTGDFSGLGLHIKAPTQTAARLILEGESLSNEGYVSPGNSIVFCNRAGGGDNEMFIIGQDNGISETGDLHIRPIKADGSIKDYSYYMSATTGVARYTTKTNDSVGYALQIYHNRSGLVLSNADVVGSIDFIGYVDNGDLNELETIGQIVSQYRSANGGLACLNFYTNETLAMYIEDHGGSVVAITDVWTPTLCVDHITEKTAGHGLLFYNSSANNFDVMIQAIEARDAMLTFICDDGDDAADKFRLRTVFNSTSANNLFKLQCDNTVKDTFVDLVTVTPGGNVSFLTDGVVTSYGAHSEVTLTHNHNVGLTLNENFTMTTAKWLGLGAGKGRISFVDDVVDYIRFSDCYVGININPAQRLHVDGAIRWGGGVSAPYGQSTVDADGLYIEQLGNSVANENIRIQTSKSGDITNYSVFTIDPTGGFSFTTTGTGNCNVGIGTAAPAYTLDVTGNFRCSTGFSCNSKTPQTAYASGGALAAYGAGTNGLNSGANMSALHALVVSMRAALVANGIMS